MSSTNNSLTTGSNVPAVPDKNELVDPAQTNVDQIIGHQQQAVQAGLTYDETANQALGIEKEIEAYTTKKLDQLTIANTQNINDLRDGVAMIPGVTTDMASQMADEERERMNRYFAGRLQRVSASQRALIDSLRSAAPEAMDRDESTQLFVANVEQGAQAAQVAPQVKANMVRLIKGDGFPQDASGAELLRDIREFAISEDTGQVDGQLEPLALQVQQILNIPQDDAALALAHLRVVGRPYRLIAESNVRPEVVDGLMWEPMTDAERAAAVDNPRQLLGFTEVQTEDQTSGWGPWKKTTSVETEVTVEGALNPSKTYVVGVLFSGEEQYRTFTGTGEAITEEIAQVCDQQSCRVLDVQKRDDEKVRRALQLSGEGTLIESEDGTILIECTSTEDIRIVRNDNQNHTGLTEGQILQRPSLYLGMRFKPYRINQRYRLGNDDAASVTGAPQAPTI